MQEGKDRFDNFLVGGEREGKEDQHKPQGKKEGIYQFVGDLLALLQHTNGCHFQIPLLEVNQSIYRIRVTVLFKVGEYVFIVKRGGDEGRLGRIGQGDETYINKNEISQVSSSGIDDRMELLEANNRMIRITQSICGPTYK